MKWGERLFGIKPNEGGLTAALLLHSFLNGLAISYLDNVANVSFLARNDVSRLPWIFLLSSALVALLGWLYSSAESWMSLKRLMIVNLAFVAVAILGFRMLLGASDAPWVGIAILGANEALWTLMMLEFWAMAGWLFTLRQGKRLFGLVGSGMALANIVAGLSVPVLVPVWGTANLLWLSLGGLLASIAVLAVIMKMYSARLAAQTEDEEPEVEVAKDSGRELLRERFPRLIFVLAGASSLGFYLLDFALFDRVSDRFAGEEDIATFFGVFAAVSGAGGLIAQTMISGRLLSRYGVTVGLLTLPILLGCGVALGLLTLSMGAAGAFFWVVAWVKFCDTAFRESVEDTSQLIVYQPLRPSLRIRVQTIIGSIVVPIVSAIAALGLIAVGAVIDLEAKHVFFAFPVVLGAWIFFGRQVGKEYLASLMGALDRRLLDGEYLELDAESVDVLLRNLDSPKRATVLYTLKLLSDQSHPKLDRALVTLLEHESALVRSDVLSRLAARASYAFSATVRRQLEREADPEAKGWALRALCAIEESEAFDKATEFIDDPAVETRMGALIGLLRHGGIEGVLAAGGRLSALSSSELASDRLFAAKVIGEVGITNFYRPVLTLLSDVDAEVRRAALEAAGKLGNAKFWPMIFEALEDPDTRQAASSALVGGGEANLAVVGLALSGSAQSEATLIRLVRVCQQIGGAEAQALLLEHLAHTSIPVRHQVFRALSALGYHCKPEEIRELNSLIAAESKAACWALASLVDLGTSDELAIVRRSLEETVSGCRERILLLLSFLHHARTVRRAQDNLSNSDVDKRAYALEVLDTLLDRDSRAMVFPLLEELPAHARLAALSRLAPQKSLETTERLEHLVANSGAWNSGWTRATAIHALGTRGREKAVAIIEANLQAPEAFVRETALWALDRLGWRDRERLEQFLGDSARNVAHMAREFLSANAANAATETPAEPSNSTLQKGDSHAADD